MHHRPALPSVRAVAAVQAGASNAGAAAWYGPLGRAAAPGPSAVDARLTRPPALACRPIVDHAVVHKENMAKMKAAYEAGKAGKAAAGGGASSGSKAAPVSGDSAAKRARKT